MGLDAVELIMDIEDAFDISISNAQASRIRTIGELFDCIVEQHRDVATARNVCLSGATFYLIRRTVCAELGLNPKTVRPTVTLESSIPRNRRSEVWAALQSSLKLKLPHLVRPARLVTVATTASIAISIGAGIVFSHATGAYRHWIGVAGDALVNRHCRSRDNDAVADEISSSAGNLRQLVKIRARP